MSLSNLNSESSRALTFTINDSLFGIDVGYILSFSDSFDEIKYANQDQIDGFVGFLDFRNTLVRVFECATALSKNKERDSIAELINKIKQFQQGHIRWMDELESCISNGSSFTLSRDPKNCEFGHWFYNFKPEDEGLQALLAKVEEPHIKLYQLADKYLNMAATSDKETAIKSLQIEKQTSLKKFLRLLDYITDFLDNSIHPIVLHLTKDGRTPWFSLVLDDIGDIVDYPASALDRSNATQSREPIDGYVRDPSGSSFMMLSLDKFYAQISEKMDTDKLSKAG